MKDMPHDLENIVNDINLQWEQLFKSLQDLAEWLARQGYEPDLKIKKLCEGVPIYRRPTG